MGVKCKAMGCLAFQRLVLENEVAIERMWRNPWGCVNTCIVV